MVQEQLTLDLDASGEQLEFPEDMDFGEWIMAVSIHTPKQLFDPDRGWTRDAHSDWP